MIRKVINFFLFAGGVVAAGLGVYISAELHQPIGVVLAGLGVAMFGAGIIRS